MCCQLRKAQALLSALLFLPAAVIPEDASPYCSQAEWDNYFEQVQLHVRGHWKPPYTQRAVNCTILVRQDFRREVAHVELLACDDDAEVRRSAENAGYNSSPLPAPSNSACFSKQVPVRLVFRP